MLSLGLALVGVALGLGGLVLSGYNTRSCPLGQAPCDHTMIIGGTTFWIGATSKGLEAAGAFVLGSGVVIYLSQWSKPQKTP